MGWKKCCICSVRVKKSDYTYISQPHFYPHFVKHVGETNRSQYDYESIVCRKCHIKINPVRSRSARNPPYSRVQPNRNRCNSQAEEENKLMEFEMSESNSASTSHQANMTSSNSSQLEMQPCSANSLNVTQSSGLEESESTFLQSQSDRSFLTDVTNSSSFSQGSLVFVGAVRSCNSTQRKCFICGESFSRCAIPKAALKQAWNEKQIFIPPTNRVCKHHLNAKLFTKSALEAITATKLGFNISSTDLGNWLVNVAGYEKKPRIDFRSEKSEEDYHTLTGFGSANFKDMLSYLSGKMRNTGNRSYVNSLGMFLMLLRHNVSQELVAYLYETSQQVVSEAIESVSEILLANFVPKHLGWCHLSEEDLKTMHAREMFNILLGLDENCIVLVADGTYLFTDKPIDFTEQRKTWSLHKNANLHKPMMFVLPSGRILEVEGLFYADNSNNDANILLALIRETESKLMEFYRKHENVAIILDRGFRDAVAEAEAAGFKIFMPKLLNKKDKQFSTTDANMSRLITMCRWIVEALNGKLKNKFKFLRERIHGKYRPKIWKFTRIACAMLNAYTDPIFTQSPKHIQYAQLALERKDSSNELQNYVLTNNLERLTSRWQVASARTVEDFPHLNLEQLESLTLGPYQMEIALRYIHDHLDEDGDFQIRLHPQEPNLIRGQIHSRHSSTSKYHLWIRYDPSKESEEGVVGWFCHCKTGARTCGMCAHNAAVIRYLALERHIQQHDLVQRRQSRAPICYRDAERELKSTKLVQVLSEPEDEILL